MKLFNRSETSTTYFSWLYAQINFVKSAEVLVYVCPIILHNKGLLSFKTLDSLARLITLNQVLGSSQMKHKRCNPGISPIVWPPGREICEERAFDRENFGKHLKNAFSEMRFSLGFQLKVLLRVYVYSVFVHMFSSRGHKGKENGTPMRSFPGTDIVSFLLFRWLKRKHYLLFKGWGSYSLAFYAKINPVVIYTKNVMAISIFYPFLIWSTMSGQKW